MFIVILDHENMGTDTIIITLTLILAKIKLAPIHHEVIYDILVS